MYQKSSAESALLFWSVQMGRGEAKHGEKGGMLGLIYEKNYLVGTLALSRG